MSQNTNVFQKIIVSRMTVVKKTKKVLVVAFFWISFVEPKHKLNLN